MKTLHCSIALSALLLTACSTKLTVRKLNTPAVSTPAHVGTAQPEGIIYALPRTVVNITLPVKRIDTAEAEFAKFAEVFFLPEYLAGDTVRPGRGGVIFKMEKPGFETLSEADPNEIYFMRLNKRRYKDLFRDLTGVIELSGTGVLTSGEVTVTNTLPEVVMATVSAAAGVITRTVLAPPPGGNDLKLKSAAPVEPELVSQCIARLPSAEEQEFVDKIGTAPGVDDIAGSADQALYCRMRAPVHIRPEYDFLCGRTSKELEELAAEFRHAARAYRIIESLTREIASLGSSMSPNPQQTRAELEALVRKATERYFTGTSAEMLWPAVFVARPTPATLTFPLFTISRTRGLVINAAQAAEGVVCPPKFCFAEPPAVDGFDPVTADFAPALAVGLVDVVRSNFAASPVTGRGIAYRVPAPHRVRLLRNNAEFARTQAPIAQLGTIASLPASLGGWSSSYKLKLDDTTGALRSASFGSKSVVRKDMVDNASANANALLDAARARREAVRANNEKDPEIETELAKRKARIEAQAAIIKACKDAGLACTPIVDPEGNPIP